MSETTTFSCPSCAAALEVKDHAVTIECPFCGSTVVVPPHLRPARATAAATAPQGSPQIIVMAPSNPIEIRAATRQATSGCARAFGLALFAIVIAVVGVAVLLPRATPDLINTVSQTIGQVIPSADDIKLTIGGTGTGSGMFQSARYVGVDGKGYFYVSEMNTRRIQKFDSTGSFVKSWMVEGKGQDSPSSLAVDPAGNVYVVMLSQILEYDGNSGTLTRRIAAPSMGDLIFDVKTLPDGGLIAATMDGSLIWFNAQGQPTNQVDKAIENITDIRSSMPRVAVDGLSNVYLLGTFDNHGVFRFSAQGKYVNRWGSDGKGADQFDFPLAIALDNQGRIYVSDRSAIKVFSGDGRYLDSITLPDVGIPQGLAIDGKNLIYATLGDKVYQLAARPATNAQ